MPQLNPDCQSGRYLKNESAAVQKEISFPAHRRSLPDDRGIPPGTYSAEPCPVLEEFEKIYGMVKNMVMRMSRCLVILVITLVLIAGCTTPVPKDSPATFSTVIGAGRQARGVIISTEPTGEKQGRVCERSEMEESASEPECSGDEQSRPIFMKAGCRNIKTKNKIKNYDLSDTGEKTSSQGSGPSRCL